VVVRDISERKRIEKQIQESELSLQAVLQSTAEGVLAISNEGKVLFSNDRFAEIWRIPPEIIATKDDKTLLRFVADQLIAPEIFIQKVQELYKSKEKSFDELYFKDGRVFERLSQSLMRGMTLSGRVWVFRNITERRKIEDGLKKAHEELNKLTIELKSAALVKSQFLTNMSHELRTPLNSINGFSEVLYEETFGPLNEKQKNYVNYILTSGRHLLLLINQILDIAKVEAKKMKLNLSSLPIKKLLNDISMLLADMVSKKKIEMLLEIPEDLPNIEGDELRVKEIIYNLLSNAVKFTPEGGKIGIRAKKTDSEIEIVVWDTGIGIAPENMNKLFEGFFRADTPYSRVTEGTGLGLPLSKKLVELHNGKFSIESGGLNKGTQVKFTLPIISKKEV
jgi:signal transduction histidine kinase